MSSFLALLLHSHPSPTQPLQVIGWRADALKMVFVVTDQNYHIAGDGKVILKFQRF